MAVGLALTAGTFTAACGGGGDQGRGQPVATPITGSSPESDYDPVSGPAEISRSKLTDLVVRGTVDQPAEGRVWADSPDDEFGALTSTVLPISVESVEQGVAPKQSHGTVYLELQRGPGDSLDWVRGKEGVFYLSKLPDEFDPADGIHPLNPELGRPSGQPMYQPAHPQGILVQPEADDVVSLESGTVYPETNLNDFLPGRARFPASSDEARYRQSQVRPPRAGPEDPSDQWGWAIL